MLGAADGAAAWLDDEDDEAPTRACFVLALPDPEVAAAAVAVAAACLRAFSSWRMFESV